MIRRYAIFPLLALASVAHARATPLDNLSAADVNGPAAVAPHIHVVVDGAPWHWADASGEPVILVGLPAGKHKVTIILADPTHKPLDHKTIEFTVPPRAAVHHF